MQNESRAERLLATLVNATEAGTIFWRRSDSSPARRSFLYSELNGPTFEISGPPNEALGSPLSSILGVGGKRIEFEVRHGFPERVLLTEATTTGGVVGVGSLGGVLGNTGEYLARLWELVTASDEADAAVIDDAIERLGGSGEGSA